MGNCVFRMGKMWRFLGIHKKEGVWSQMSQFHCCCCTLPKQDPVWCHLGVSNLRAVQDKARLELHTTKVLLF